MFPPPCEHIAAAEKRRSPHRQLGRESPRFTWKLLVSSLLSIPAQSDFLASKDHGHSNKEEHIRTLGIESSTRVLNRSDLLSACYDLTATTPFV